MRICPTTEQLTQFLEDSLPESTRSQLAQHVDACAHCQEALDHLTSHAACFVPPPSSTDSTISALVKRLCETPWILHEARSENRDEMTFPEPPRPDAPVGKIGPYLIQERIAAGANGIMYRAIDSELGRTVGLKVMRASSAASTLARTRLLREARAAATIKSDYIVPVIQVGNYANFPPFLVLEFVDGKSLREHLDVLGSLRPQDAAAIAREIALGLAAAHEKGLVHRDVKPSNILLDAQTGRARITDFGLARSDEEISRLTLDGAIAGTPAYMSVEQLMEPGKVDGRSDIYGLGVVLYELLTGALPFRGVLRMTISQILHDEPIPPRRLNDTIPRDLETICLKAMAKERERRYRTAKDIASDLEAFLKGGPIAAQPEGPLGKLHRWIRRNKLMTSLIALAAGLLVTLTIVSTYAAIRLARAHANSLDNARLASQQRDAALETLGRLVFDIQEEFDSDEVDLDELQEHVLQIALDGLGQVDPQGQLGGFSSLQIATAYRRLGELVGRTEGDERADVFFQKATGILRKLYNANPSDGEIVRQLAETALSGADFHAYDNDLAAERYAEQAVEWCRLLPKPGMDARSSKELLASALMTLGQAQRAIHQNQDYSRSESSFDEASRILRDMHRDQFDDPSDARKRLECMLGMALAHKDGFDRRLWEEVLLLSQSEHERFPQLLWPVELLFMACDGLERTREGAPPMPIAAADIGFESENLVSLSDTLLVDLQKNSSAGPLFLDDVTAMFEGLARNWSRLGDLKLALRNDLRRVQFLEERLKQAPIDSHARHNLGLAMLDYATSLRSQSQLDQAYDYCKQAIDILKPLMEAKDRDPDVTDSFADAMAQAKVLALELDRVEDAEGLDKLNMEILRQQPGLLETKD